METTIKNVFETLRGVDVSGMTEEKNGLTYLSWAHAFNVAISAFPELEYEVVKFNGLPYVYDDSTGYMVYTRMTIGGVTREMWLPVMDSANKSMFNHPYTYQVYDKFKKAYVDKSVAAATMFDINKTIMRCLVKNLALFGLGLDVYAGEDLPDVVDILGEEPAPAKPEAKPKKTAKREDTKAQTANNELAAAISAAQAAETTEQLIAIWNANREKFGNNDEFKKAVATHPMNPNAQKK